MTDAPERPSTDDRDAWKVYWTAQGMPWRADPVIDEGRQLYLDERRAITPDIEQGIYPFRDEGGSIKLTRADVEWLLATHESGGFIGPIHLSSDPHKGREGLDLRGANLRGANLQGLPLARLRGGLTYDERAYVPLEKHDIASMHLEGAILSNAHLELANLSRAYFEGAILRGTYLSGADLFHARLEKTTLTGAHLDGADLRFVFFDTATYLRDIILATDNAGPCWLAGVRWGGADLSLVNWSQLRELKDELWARQPLNSERKPKGRDTRVGDYQTAVRANRKLASVLRDQGLNEDADNFAYRAQQCQRSVLRLQRHYLRFFGSIFLGAVAGYGYRPLRSFATYFLVILGFAATYLVLGIASGHALRWNEAIVISMTAFHGRGFFSTAFQPSDPQAGVAAAEAFIGLFIEITFIATFTQRFFAR